MLTIGKRMTEAGSDLATVLSAWVTATRGITVLPPLTETEMGRRITSLRLALRGDGAPAIKTALSGETIDVLSRLCFDLAHDQEQSRITLFGEAAAAYRLVSGWAVAPDQSADQKEILASLALEAWRNARLACSPVTAQAWEDRYDDAIGDVFGCVFDQPSSVSSGFELQDYSLQAAPDVRDLFLTCASLKRAANSRPRHVLMNGTLLHRCLENSPSIGLADERAFLLGTTALLAGMGCRMLGNLQEGERWLEDARSWFAKTAAPEPPLARVSYAQLCIDYSAKRFRVILEGGPALSQRFDDCGMRREALKSRFLTAATRAECGQQDTSLRELLALRDVLLESDSAGILGWVLAKVGEVYGETGRYREAFEYYKLTLAWLGRTEAPCLRAILKGSIGETLLQIGQTASAIEAFRESITDYADVGMESQVAYMRVVLADALLLVGRAREAELEILAALPILEKAMMRWDGLVALSLLRESVHHSNTDRAALRKVREWMGASR